jgi:hypothetical protein
MTVLHGEAALDFMFGDKWRELNAETERRDKAIADLLNVPCSQPACSGLACVNIDAPGGERAVCSRKTTEMSIGRRRKKNDPLHHLRHHPRG